MNTMMTTDKESCRTIIELLVAHGVEDAVISPGSRNTPLIIAAHRNAGLRTHVVIDERCAAFFGLGIALQTHKPVALICTSGSAVLNYAPAISEAYYRHIPLIAISADRPAEWIDQDDSQTIRQNGVIDNIVKGSFDIYGENGAAVYSRFTSRTINDAIALATRGPKGPVHINVRLDEPLGNISDIESKPASRIELIEADAKRLSDRQFDRLAEEAAGKKIMIVCGFGASDHKLDKALDDFARRCGAVILKEAQSNVHTSIAVSHIDSCLSTFTKDDYNDLKPDLVITTGGSIVSRMIKQYLRSLNDIEHWHIAESRRSIDCFLALTKRIECETDVFFDELGSRLSSNAACDCQYLKKWTAKHAEAREKMKQFLPSCGWSDFYAMGRMMKLTPRNWHLQLSNGTVVRYAQLFDYSAFSNIECNRGVSGIDGCTSTAIGAHLDYNDVTLLISGDMSAQYDAGALALNEISPRFKMAVLNNSGGGIFRFIKSTSHLEECEECFAAKVNLPLKQLAEGYGFAYFEASDKESFDEAFSLFAVEKERPALLNIITPPRQSAELLKEFFTTTK